VELQKFAEVLSPLGSERDDSEDYRDQKNDDDPKNA
jgi:hypothetical protein